MLGKLDAVLVLGLEPVREWLASIPSEEKYDCQPLQNYVGVVSEANLI